MPLYGQAGEGASNALMQVLADQFRQQLLQREQEARERQFNETLALDKQRLAGVEADRAEGQRRQRVSDNVASDQRNVRRMIPDVLARVMQGGGAPEDRLSLAKLQVEAGGDVDPALLQQPTVAPPKRTLVTTIGKRGEPWRQGFTDEELAVGVPEYREPDKPAPGPQPRPEPPPDKPKSEYSLEHSRDVVRKVDDILPRISEWTAGLGGALLKNVPRTPAANMAADLQSLAANLAFDQLQRMREASKTGGALGQVAVRELELLENVEASIKQNQSPANLRKNLEIIRESAKRYLGAAEQGGGLAPMKPMSSHGGGAPQSKFSIVSVK